MAGDAAKKRILDIRREIEDHNRKYYVEATPEISDAEYDRLYRELLDLEEKYPELADDASPTRRVGGGKIDGFISRPHKTPMLSLDNTYSKEDLAEFFERVRKGLERKDTAYAVEPKIDGVAVSLHFENGRLAVGLTRGDGRSGDDITVNLKCLSTIPLKLPKSMTIEIRGEVFMNNRSFSELNRERRVAGETPFVNPRNAAAGSLKLLDPGLVAKRKLAFMAHSVGRIDGKPFETYSQAMEFFESAGFVVPPGRAVTTGDSVFSEIERIYAEKPRWAFDVDGAVIKIDRLAERDKLGETAKSPRWAIAYKYAAERAQTSVKKIELGVGRTGVITPTAVFDPPVHLSRTTVSRASLHNFDEIRRLDVREGDLVLVEKAGEIIPQVVEVLKEKRKRNLKQFRPKRKCPVCRGPLVRLEEEVALRCTNLSCPAQLERRIEYYASKAGVDIEGLGEKIVEILIREKLIGSIPDLYRLSRHRDRLLHMEGFAEKRVDNLIAAVEQTKTAPLERLLAALGIPHVGAVACRDLALQFGSLDKIRSARPEDFSAIAGFGAKMAESLSGFFKQNKKLMDELARAGLRPSTPERIEAADNPLKGKRVVITGALPTLARGAAEDAIRRLGGFPGSSVTKQTDLLVVGAEPGSKLDKARKLNVRTAPAEGFEKMISKHAL